MPKKSGCKGLLPICRKTDFVLQILAGYGQPKKTTGINHKNKQAQGKHGDWQRQQHQYRPDKYIHQANHCSGNQRPAKPDTCIEGIK